MDRFAVGARVRVTKKTHTLFGWEGLIEGLTEETAWVRFDRRRHDLPVAVRTAALSLVAEVD